MSKSKKHSAKANIHILNIENLPIFIHWIQRVLPLYSVKHHLQPHESAQICISEIADADLSNPCRACSHRREKRSQWQNRPLSLPSPEPKALCGLIIPIPSSHSKTVHALLGSATPACPISSEAQWRQTMASPSAHSSSWPPTARHVVWQTESSSLRWRIGLAPVRKL